MFKKASFFIIIFCLIILICSNFKATAQDILKITNVNVENNTITIYENNAEALQEPDVKELINPDRIIFNLNNTILTCPKQSYDFLGGNTNFKIAQYSTNPNVVRIVFTADTKDDLQKISFTKSQNELKFSFNPILKPKIIAIPAYEKNMAENNVVIANQTKPDMVIKTIKYINNHLILTGTGSMSIKEPFLLQNPNRIVFDISSSIIASREVFKEFLLTNGDKARVAQFDPTTVRITIETSNPNNYKAILSHDLNLLMIKPLQIVTNSDIKPVLQNTPNQPMSFKVVIDAGHGGSDPGAQRSEICEKDITLSVAKKIQENLTNAGVGVIMTRNGDDTVSLKERTDLTNCEKPDVFVSVHVNSSECPNVTGIETHWYTDQSKELAKTIQNKLSGSIPTINRGIVNSKFYVIHHTDVPAVLVEIGFISNDADRCQLLTEERQMATAKSISDGIMEFLNSRTNPQKPCAEKK